MLFLTWLFLHVYLQCATVDQLYMRNGLGGIVTLVNYNLPANCWRNALTFKTHAVAFMCWRHVCFAWVWFAWSLYVAHVLSVLSKHVTLKLCNIPGWLPPIMTVKGKVHWHHTYPFFHGAGFPDAVGLAQFVIFPCSLTTSISNIFWNRDVSCEIDKELCLLTLPMLLNGAFAGKAKVSFHFLEQPDFVLYANQTLLVILSTHMKVEIGFTGTANR